ncbi:phosphatase PAP2 family protein [Roseospira visakhapatnamensis]|uniref:Membrane-associated phospholipid phosphatase n=1 Tax=Roseospira visakhapatnamensis TaxID=390880 RepID=A0A7W6W8T2_9PROT|nr:phosphatase PAP2 family protein [Roseospira visakhapatnamensis]MBB4264707.1 membrane-associated phospholipid phosphatase [Roseospira visakhapatnamensis]
MTFAWVVLACLLSIALLDQPLALALKARVDGDWQGFWRVLTALGSGWPWYTLGLATWGVCRWREARSRWPDSSARWAARARATAFLLAGLALSGVLVTALKALFGRLRPVWLFREGEYGFAPLSFEWAANSFPSGHSQTIWAAMTALMLIFPRHWPTWVTLGILVAASRLFLTVHYLSDVLMGSLIGIATVVLLARWARRRGHDIRLGNPR